MCVHRDHPAGWPSCQTLARDSGVVVGTVNKKIHEGKLIAVRMDHMLFIDPHYAWEFVKCKRNHKRYCECYVNAARPQEV